MQEQLKRSIGVFGLAAAVINMTIGTGIFVLPALAAEKMGAAALLAFLICGVLIFLIAMCFAEVGSRFDISGGPYTYIEFAFGKYAGFLANITFLTSCVLADAGAAKAVAKTLSFFWPLLDTPVVQRIFFILLFGILALINIRGAQQGMRFVVISTIAKLIPLLLVVALGMGKINLHNLEWQLNFGLNETGSTVLLLFIAFVGMETAVSNGGEFKNPSRTVPLGVLSGLLIVLLLYIIIQLITQGVMGAELIKVKEAPIAALAEQLMGKIGLTITVIGSSVSMIGLISGEVLSIPRILYAGARDGLLPGFLFKVHTKFATPHYAILVYTAIGCTLAITGGLQQLLILSSATIMLIHLGVILALIKFRKQSAPQPGFKVPGGLFIPVLACIAIIWVLSNLTTKEILGMLLALCIISCIYVLSLRLQKQNRLDKRR